MPVRSQSTRFVLTWAIGVRRVLEKDAHRLHRRHTAGDSRTVFAILMATASSSVRRLMLKAIERLALRPPRRRRAGGDGSGRSRARVPGSCRSPRAGPRTGRVGRRRDAGAPAGAPPRRRDRPVGRSSGDLLAEASSQVDALLEARGSQRHEGDDVDGADPRVRAGVLFHVDQLERPANGGGRGTTTGSALPAKVTTLRLCVSSRCGRAA